MKRRLRDVPAAFAMLLPSLVLVGVWTIYPLVKAVQRGHQRCDATGTRCRDAGWDQYVDVFRSNEFQHSLGVSLRLALMTVPTGLVLGVALAVLADKQLRGIRAYRVAFSSTVATSVAVASLVWFVLLQPEIGVLSDLFSKWIPSLKNPGLLRDPDTALPAVALSSVWAGLGFTFIVVLAALQGVPRDLYESAFVDGAGSWRRFTNVTLPMLTPAMLFITVVLTTRALQTYGEVALLTGGGPNPEQSTTTIPYLIYGQNSLIQNDLGLQSAAAVLLFLICLVFAVVQFRGFERRVQYARADTPTGMRAVGRYAFLTVVAVIVVFPIYAVLMQALKSGPDALDHPRSLLPVDLTLDTIRAAWDEGNLGRLMLNSLFVSVMVTIGVVVTSLLAAYAFSFLHFPGRNLVFMAFLATMLVPAEVTVVINRRTADSLGWINSYQGLIIPSLASTFGLLFVRQTFLQLPKELREAASLDGVGHLRFLWEVAAPLSRPTLGALGLFTFLGTWNAYLWPSQVITDEDHQTIQIGLESLKTPGDMSRFNLLTGGLVIAALPIFIMLIMFQRQLIRGLTAGAVKG